MREAKYYATKPFIIMAIQWTGSNLDELFRFAGPRILGNPDTGILVDNFLESVAIPCPVGHWVIRGMKGEFYPCDPEVFAAKYEERKP